MGHFGIRRSFGTSLKSNAQRSYKYHHLDVFGQVSGSFRWKLCVWYSFSNGDHTLSPSPFTIGLTLKFIQTLSCFLSSKLGKLHVEESKENKTLVDVVEPCSDTIAHIHQYPVLSYTKYRSFTSAPPVVWTTCRVWMGHPKPMTLLCTKGPEQPAPYPKICTRGP